MSKSRKAVSFSIIGGADGPTSVFLAGKIDNKRKKKKSEPERRQRKLDKIKKQIKPGTHTLEELEEYICNKYGAYETSPESLQYSESYKNLKSSFVYKYHPELIEIEFPEFPRNEIKNPEELEGFFKKTQEWYKAAEKVTDELIPFNFKQYIIKVSDQAGEGSVLVDIEYEHQFIGVSAGYSGKSKSCNTIIKDIYCYYGVSDEDMKEDSERFKTLALILSDNDAFKKRKPGNKRKKLLWICFGAGIIAILLSFFCNKKRK